MKLTPWRPLNEIERFFDDEDWTLMVPPKFMSVTAVDVYEKDDNLIAEADIVGVKPENVEVTVEDNVLTIQGETKEEQEEEGKRYYKRERRVGRVYRSIRLPKSVDGTKVKAEYDNGKLVITMPIAQEAKQKKVQVEMKTRK